MSFCNPTTIDDYFLDPPPTDLDLAVTRKTIKEAPGTPQDFGNKDTADITPLPTKVTQQDVRSLHDDLKGAASILKTLAGSFKTIGFDAKALEKAYSKIIGADGSISIGNFFRNFGDMSSAVGSLVDIIGSGLGLNTHEWLNQAAKIKEQAAPVVNFIGKLGQLVNNSDHGGTSITDELLTSIFVDITNAMSNIFGDDNGLTRALAGLTQTIATAQGLVNFLNNAANDLEDSAIAILDTAESLMAAGLGMAAAICKFIPVFIAMMRSMYEMIAGLISALEAFLADPLGHLPKFTLDIDFSKLFKLPELDLFRRFKDRWDRFTGSSFKMWKTTTTECSADAWNSRIQGPGKISEAATSLSSALLYGSTLITRAADAPEGISKIGGGLELKVGADFSNMLAAINGVKSMVKVKPAVVNPTPSTPELSFKSNTSIPADIGSIKLPHGLGSLNGTKAFDVDPKTGFPIRPGIHGSVSNNLDVFGDMCGTVRAGEICAANTYRAGYSLKSAATGGDGTKALRDLLAAARRLRYIQTGIHAGDGSDPSQISRDYFACSENAKSSKYTIDSMGDAQTHLGTAMSTPAGLPGSIMERAAFNNPGVFMTADNNVGIIKDTASVVENTPPTDEVLPTSILGQLSIGSLVDKTKLSDPDAVIDSPASARLDDLLVYMPLAAMPPSYYETSRLPLLLSTITPDNPDITKVPLSMVCRDEAQVKKLAQLVTLQAILDAIDPKVSDGLYEKALIQGLLEDNGYTWLAIGKKLIGTEKLPDLLEGFLNHSKKDFRAILQWLDSSAVFNITDPEAPLGLTDDETQLAEKSIRFLQDNNKESIANTFILLRQQADMVGGPLGYEFVIFLACDTILKEIESRMLNNQDMSAKLVILKTMADKLTHYKPLAALIDKLSKSKV